MDQVVLVCGSWFFEKNRWLFAADPKKGCKILAVNDTTRFDDVLKIVHEDYKMEKKRYEVSLSYMFPKKRMVKLPRDTPPVFVGNCRQFHEFILQWKSDPIRLCVEFNEKEVSQRSEDDDDSSRGKSRKRAGDDISTDEEDDEDAHSEVMSTHDKSEEEEDEEYRFDYCDDSDRATSDDEDFSVLGRLPEEDGPKKPKILSACLNRGQVNAKLDLDSLRIAVGQKYKTKDELETRLKILSVLDQFDFEVDRSTTDLYVVNCWVEGCTWRVRASPIGDSTEFCVRIVEDEHTCSITERSARSRQATPEIVEDEHTCSITEHTCFHSSDFTVFSLRLMELLTLVYAYGFIDIFHQNPRTNYKSVITLKNICHPYTNLPPR